MEGKNCPPEKHDRKKLEKNNLTNALNVLYAKNEKKYILPTFQHITQSMKKKSFFNDSKKRRMPLKQLSILVRGISSKHNGDFYCLNCLHLFRKENKLESHKKAFL